MDMNPTVSAAYSLFSILLLLVAGVWGYLIRSFWLMKDEKDKTTSPNSFGGSTIVTIAVDPVPFKSFHGLRLHGQERLSHLGSFVHEPVPINYRDLRSFTNYFPYPIKSEPVLVAFRDM